jgi:hypothetical protein
MAAHVMPNLKAVGEARGIESRMGGMFSGKRIGRLRCRAERMGDSEQMEELSTTVIRVFMLKWS